jgi:predicted phosphoribosyltransferase
MRLARRVPAARGEHRQAVARKPIERAVDDGEDLVAAGHGQRAAGQEVVLHAHEEQRIAGAEPKIVEVEDRHRLPSVATVVRAAAGANVISMLFSDRREAGRRLAARLAGYRGRADVTVLALPRGGIPVGYEVARALGAPLDVFVVRKLGVPGQEELAMGAVASGGAVSINASVAAALDIPREKLAELVEAEAAEVAARDQLYREGRPPLPLAGRTLLVVDDGLATGATMRAALLALRRLAPARVVVAVPVAPAEVCDEMAELADEVVCLETPEPYFAVGQFYRDFSETTNDEVRHLLRDAAAEPTAASP